MLRIDSGARVGHRSRASSKSTYASACISSWTSCCRTGGATPTTVHSCSWPTRLPSSAPPGSTAARNASFTTTRCDPASLSASSRPRVAGVPVTWKYDGVTVLSRTIVLTRPRGSRGSKVMRSSDRVNGKVLAAAARTPRRPSRSSRPLYRASCRSASRAPAPRGCIRTTRKSVFVKPTLVRTRLCRTSPTNTAWALRANTRPACRTMSGRSHRPRAGARARSCSAPRARAAAAAPGRHDAAPTSAVTANATAATCPVTAGAAVRERTPLSSVRLNRSSPHAISTAHGAAAAATHAAAARCVTSTCPVVAPSARRRAKVGCSRRPRAAKSQPTFRPTSSSTSPDPACSAASAGLIGAVRSATCGSTR